MLGSYKEVRWEGVLFFVATAGSLRGVGEIVWWTREQLDYWMWAKFGWINLL